MKKVLLTSIMALILFGFHSICAGSDQIGFVVERADTDAIRQGKCPHCGRPLTGGTVHKNAEAILLNILRDRMVEKGLVPEEGRGTKRHIHLYIYRFEERRGGNYAVEKPAAVAFHMHLMQGNTIGLTYVFNERQQPLNENLFEIGKFVKRGAKWVTATELAREGIDKGLDLMVEALKE